MRAPAGASAGQREADELVCFSVYGTVSSELLEPLFRGLDHRFAAALGVPLYTRDAYDHDIALILSSEWWKDHAWTEVAAPAPATPRHRSPGSQFHAQVLGQEVAMDVKRHPMTLKPVLYTVPGMDEVVTREVEYATGRVIELYTPPGASGRLPAVVFVGGYADPGCEQVFGCKLKDMAAYVSWARLVAVAGPSKMIGVTYTNREPADAHAMLAYLRAHAAELGIDDQRVAIWACSGNVPMALSLLDGMRCAALCYGIMGDRDGGTETAQAAAMFRFANPATPLEQLPRIPLFLARAGRDEMPGLNVALDRFVAAAIAQDRAITLANHPTGPHSFELLDDSPTTRAIVQQILAFLQIRLA